MEILRVQRKPFITVGTSFADYIADVSSVRAALQGALDEINTAGGGEVFLKRPSGGIYTRSGLTMTIGSNTRLILEEGTTIFTANSISNSTFTNKDTTNGNSGIIIEGGIIDQNGANQSGGGGVSFTGLFDSKLIGVTFEKSRVFNTFIGSLAGTSLTGTLTFTNGDTTVTGSSTLFTTELSVGDVVKSNAGNFQRVRTIASDTSLELDRAWGWATESGVAAKRVAPNARNQLLHCKFKGTVATSDNVGLGLFDDSLIQGCISQDSTGYGFGPDHANRTKFIGNTCKDNVSAGIGMETCGDCIVSNNHLNGNGAGVYMLSGAYRNLITGNNCTGNTNGINIAYNITTFPYPDENKITNNYCQFNATDGVRVGGAALTTVSGNHCLNNGNAGVRILTENSRVPDRTIISTNMCYDNQDTKTQDRGIHIANGTNTLVANNIALAADHTTAGITDSGTASTLDNNLT